MKLKETLLGKIAELRAKEKPSLSELEKLTRDVQGTLLEKTFMFTYCDDKDDIDYYADHRYFYSDDRGMIAKTFIKWYLGEFSKEDYLEQLRLLITGRENYRDTRPPGRKRYGTNMYNNMGFAGMNIGPKGSRAPEKKSYFDDDEHYS